MKKVKFLQHGLLLSTLLLSIVILVAIGFSSCSSSKKYGQTVNHNPTRYQKVRVKQVRWNTTTSTSTTYYIKKQKQPKRYNP